MRCTHVGKFKETKGSSILFPVSVACLLKFNGIFQNEVHLTNYNGNVFTMKELPAQGEQSCWFRQENFKYNSYKE